STLRRRYAPLRYCVGRFLRSSHLRSGAEIPATMARAHCQCRRSGVGIRNRGAHRGLACLLGISKCGAFTFSRQRDSCALGGLLSCIGEKTMPWELRKKRVLGEPPLLKLSKLPK